MKRKQPVKHKNLYILLAFLLITMALLIAVTICCYIMKFQAKKKLLLPFDDANNKLKHILY